MFGFTIVELLMALAISAVLLAGLTLSLNALFVNFVENEQLYRTVNNARQALCRITTQLRTAQAVDANVSTTECKMITSDGDDISYRYDSSDNKLYLITNDDTSDDDYLLCDNVTAMSFTRQTATDTDGLYVKSVQISMSVAGEQQSRTVSAAAVIRKNLGRYLE